jgi:uncharacterized membrane protein YdjX (TVP38/TMEM64 family)
MQMRQRKFVVGMALLAASVTLYVLLKPYLSLAYLESQRSEFLQLYQQHPAMVSAVYGLISVLLISLALPVTGVLALLGGALFGFYWGWILTALTGTLGALIVFLWSRYLFRDALQRRFQRQFSIVSSGIESEGIFYLFSIRLIAVFPFFLVNVLCGLTNLKLSAYFAATLVGQTAVVAIWVYAGSEIASLESVGDVLNIKSVLLLSAAGFLPFLAHRLMGKILTPRNEGDNSVQ